jgi:hypothetical protein
MNNAVFWEVTSCRSCKTHVAWEIITSIIRVTIGELGTTLAATTNYVFLHSILQLLVTANVPSWPVLVTLMMEAIRSPETSVLTRRRNIPEDGILLCCNSYFLIINYM